MKQKKYIVDTTLRDGEQSPGFAFSKEEKVLLAGLLDKSGVDQIEAGIPAMGSYEKETLCEIMRRREKAMISTWNRLNLSDIRHSLDCAPDIIHISAPVSYIQIYKKLNKNKTWIIKQLQTCVDAAQSRGYTVTVGFEDATRADISFMATLAAQIKDMGVKRVRFADTVGVLTPSRTYEMIRELIEYTGMAVEMHAHNDLGMAVANSLAAARAGADYLDTTILGIGERAGNCDFQKLVFASERIFALSVSHFTSEAVEEQARPVIYGDEMQRLGANGHSGACNR